MSDLTRVAVGTVGLAVEDQSGGDPRSDREEHAVPVAAPGAEPRLGQRTGAHIVPERDRQRDTFGEHVTQRGIPPPQVLREHRESRGLIDDSGHGHPHRGRRRASAQPLHALAHRVRDAFGDAWSGPRCGDPKLGQDRASVTREHGLDGGAADVHSYGQQR